MEAHWQRPPARISRSGMPPPLVFVTTHDGARQAGWAMELIGGGLKFMTRWFDIQFDRSNVSDVSEMPGSQVGSQRRQIPGGARP
jgi:hypothetical protein